MTHNKLSAWLDKFVRYDLGEISNLPENVHQRIITTYTAFACAYLGWLRLDEEQPHDWIPEEAAIKTTLVHAMAHFYSDHQRVVADRNLLKAQVRRLQAIDPRRFPDAYAEEVRSIVNGVDQRAAFNQIYQELKNEQNGGNRGSDPPSFQCAAER